jgi:hypothetical protein
VASCIGGIYDGCDFFMFCKFSLIFEVVLVFVGYTGIEIIFCFFVFLI